MNIRHSPYVHACMNDMMRIKLHNSYEHCSLACNGQGSSLSWRASTRAILPTELEGCTWNTMVLPSWPFTFTCYLQHMPQWCVQICRGQSCKHFGPWSQATSQDCCRNTKANNAVDNERWTVRSYPNVINAFVTESAHRLPEILFSQHHLMIHFLCAVWAEHDGALLVVARICISGWTTER